MNFINKLLRTAAIFLLFIFTLSILIHTNTNLDQDLGRHIKTGEIIWQTRSIPKTNLFSYTHSDFPFVNHHWDSEVVFYLLYKHFGLLSISYLKIILIFLTILILLYASLKSHTSPNSPPPAGGSPIPLISLSLFLPLLATRTDERPEIFGFLFFSLFLAIFVKYKQDDYKGKIIWLIPFVQLIWTNMHITFIYGFLLIFLFLFDAFLSTPGVEERSGKTPGVKMLKIAIISLLLSLLNPNGLSGLLYPLNVFRNYGYSIAENQNLFFLSTLTSNIFIKIFWIQAMILIIFGLISFFLSLKHKTLKADLIFYLISSIYCLLSIFMLRNFPFFVFTGIICFSYFLKNISRYINSMKILIYPLIISINIIFIYLITSNTFYETFDINKKFDLRVVSSYEKSVDFFIENKLPGPIFNNFDIGGYLDFRGLKVFIDNRPEAYPALFFEEYKSAQLYPDEMNRLINKYKINSIIFSHTDGTDWGASFVKNINQLKDFKLVYLDPSVFILTRSDYQISHIAPIIPISPTAPTSLTSLTTQANNYQDLLHLARFYSLIGEDKLAIQYLEKAYKLNPRSCGARLSYGLLLANQPNLFTKNQGIQILNSTWYCPYPKSIKESLSEI